MSNQHDTYLVVVRQGSEFQQYLQWFLEQSEIQQMDGFTAYCELPNTCTAIVKARKSETISE